MAETSGPFNGVSVGDAGPYSDSDWWNIWKHIIGHGANRPNSGVIRGNGVFTAADGDTESLFVVNTSPASAAVNLRPGSALVDGTAYINDSPLTLSIAANASGNSRIDTVILRKLFAAQTVRAVVLQGTPAGTPVPTALTQTPGVIWEIPIAYVTAASGFVTITGTDIVQVNEVANGNNIEVMDYVTNNSAITLEPGMVVVWHSGNRAVTTTTTPFDRNIAGIWTGRTAPGAKGRLQVGGLANVKLLTTPTNGQVVVTSATAGSGQATSFEGVPNIGRVVGASIAPAQSQVQLNPDTGGEFGAIAANRLSAVGATLDSGTFIPFYNSIEVEFYLRSETASTLDAFLFRFGDIASGFDATAGNYFSYAVQHSSTVPTATAIENLGAVAGIRINGPAASAGANLFVHGKFRMWDVRSTATRKKGIEGQANYRIGNLTGNLAVQTFGGEWENATIRCEQVRVVTVSGANLSADSQILVRAIRSMALP